MKKKIPTKLVNNLLAIMDEQRTIADRRRAAIQALIDAGMTLAAVARIIGVSRQRVWQDMQQTR